MTTRRVQSVYVWLALALLAVVIIALTLGSASLQDEGLRSTILELRFARMSAAFLAGASLAVGGVAVQGLFRNPLASPSILGTTAGANLGGQLALIVTHALVGAQLGASELALPVGCFVGALVALGILLLFMRAGSDLLTVLLTGFILSSLFLSIGSFLTSMVQESWALGRALLTWALGGVAGTGLRQNLLALPFVAVAIGAVWFWGRALDVLLSGEEEAAALGVDVQQTRLWVVVWVSVLTGAAVSLGGGVAFVGLIVPHLLRPFIGAEHRKLVPAAAIFGGVFLIACDDLARAIPAQTEVPLGIVTGLIGAPLFLVMLIRVSRGGAYA